MEQTRYRSAWFYHDGRIFKRKWYTDSLRALHNISSTYAWMAGVHYFATKPDQYEIRSAGDITNCLFIVDDNDAMIAILTLLGETK